jgi:hypothetical protein
VGKNHFTAHNNWGCGPETLPIFVPITNFARIIKTHGHWPVVFKLQYTFVMDFSFFCSLLTVDFLPKTTYQLFCVMQERKKERKKERTLIYLLQAIHDYRTTARTL